MNVVSSCIMADELPADREREPDPDGAEPANPYATDAVLAVLPLLRVKKGGGGVWNALELVLKKAHAEALGKCYEMAATLKAFYDDLTFWADLVNTVLK